MRQTKFQEKRPADIQSYVFDFTTWIDAVYDTPVYFGVYEFQPADMTDQAKWISVDSATYIDGMLYAVVSGGAANNVYQITAVLDTASGLRKLDNLRIRVLDREI